MEEVSKLKKVKTRIPIIFSIFCSTEQSAAMMDTAQVTVFICLTDRTQRDGGISYEEDSKENLKIAIKFLNTVRLSFTLTTVILMV